MEQNNIKKLKNAIARPFLKSVVRISKANKSVRAKADGFKGHALGAGGLVSGLLWVRGPDGDSAVGVKTVNHTGARGGPEAQALVADRNTTIGADF